MHCHFGLHLNKFSTRTDKSMNRLTAAASFSWTIEFISQHRLAKSGPNFPKISSISTIYCKSSAASGRPECAAWSVVRSSLIFAKRPLICSRSTWNAVESASILTHFCPAALQFDVKRNVKWKPTTLKASISCSRVAGITSGLVTMFQALFTKSAKIGLS